MFKIKSITFYIFIALLIVSPSVWSQKDDESSVESTPELTPVQATSLAVAYYRHLETHRNDTGRAPSPPLIRDDYAEILLRQLGNDSIAEKWMKSPMCSGGVNMMALRSRSIDDWLLQDQKRQFVNLGAGMCTRPYRLDWENHGDMVIFEVEKDAALLKFKRDTLANAGHKPKVRVIDVQSDVTAENLTEVLIRAGFDPSIPTNWLAEGLLGYLPASSHIEIFRRLRKVSAPGSRISAWNSSPWIRDLYHSIGMDLPHVGLREAKETKNDIIAAGWIKNVTVWNDENTFWPMYKRAMNVPLYSIVAEANDGKEKPEL